MIYPLFRSLALSILRAPKHPPEAPAGTHASIEVFRASPRFLTYRLLLFSICLGAVLLLAGGLLIVGIASGEERPLWVGIGAGALSAVVFLPIYLSVRIDYDLRYYILTDRSLRVREGAWIVREKTITHANAQNLRVKQGPLQRLLGIADLQVETAGGGGGHGEAHKGSAHTVHVAGIENAREVRDKILAHLRSQGSGTGLGDPDDVSPVLGFRRAPELISALEQVQSAAVALRQAAQSVP